MDDKTKTMMLTLVTGVIKKGLLVAGSSLAGHGIINSNQTETFVSIGMVLVGLGWSLWNDYGKAIILSQLEVLKAKSLAQAAKMREAGISPVTTTQIAVQSATLTPTEVAKTVATLPSSIQATIVKILLVAFLVSAFLAPRAFAADVLATKALNIGYPTTKCGIYYGVGTGGNAGAVNGAAVGTQIVQGDLDAIVGYTCPFATNAFWFAEASFGFANLNGSVNGLALSGPLVAIERVGAGSPINSILGSLMPANINPSLPSIPLLPAGVTTSPGNGYLFVGLVEQDIGAQIGLLHGHQWVIAPLLGVGILTRASNNVMIDTWAGWQANSQSFCPGGGSACAKLGNMARVGVSFKY